MITVIADDLTGAAEIAGICLRYGIEVAFGIDALPENLSEVNVIATDSRSMTEEEAYKTHLQLANSIISKKENQIIFKKCDSVLRGYVVTEFHALLGATGKRRIVFQPSNPADERCIRLGYYWIHNVLIENTGFAEDPDFPSNSSRVEDLLLERSSRISKIYTGIISEINSEGVFIPDCNSVEDLKKGLQLHNENTIIGGSAAFFEQFLLKEYPNLSEIKPEKHHFLEHYLLLSGSTHTESILFTSSIKDRNCPVLKFPNSLLEKKDDNIQLNDFIEEATLIYNENKKLVLRISDTIIEFEGSSKILKSRMSSVVKHLLDKTTVNELFIEGGATAYDLLQKLNWKSFTPVAELALGVVRMRSELDQNKFITLKPGSYKWLEGILE